jgi:hypothetical protein
MAEFGHCATPAGDARIIQNDIPPTADINENSPDYTASIGHL